MRAIVVIVGRPNVGKSTLFNRMIKTGANRTKLTAIVESTPGVTRDRNYGEAEWEGKGFAIVDTGGFYTEGIDRGGAEVARQVTEHAMFAIEEADLIIHLLDGRGGLNPTDMELANILRESGKEVLWVANKIDTPAREVGVAEFYSIGADEIMPLSAITGLGFDEVMDKIITVLSPRIAAWEGVLMKTPDGIPNIAVIGRPNVGKSTLINSLLGKKRHIVSPVPGTTRDSIDSIGTYYGKKYLLIDTAGVRQKSKIYSIERFSVVRAIRSIERADVVIIVLDVTDGIVEQDQKIAGIVNECGKGAIFLINKWDLVEEPDLKYKKITQELKDKMWFMNYVPYATTSGLEKKRITKIFPMIDEIITERRKRISTNELNKFLSNVISAIHFPAYRGRKVKFSYITQVGVAPPAFVIFANHPSALKRGHIRSIERAIRKEYSFKGTPIRIYPKKKMRWRMQPVKTPPAFPAQGETS